MKVWKNFSVHALNTYIRRPTVQRLVSIPTENITFLILELYQVQIEILLLSISIYISVAIGGFGKLIGFVGYAMQIIVTYDTYVAKDFEVIVETFINNNVIDI